MSRVRNTPDGAARENGGHGGQSAARAALGPNGLVEHGSESAVLAGAPPIGGRASPGGGLGGARGDSSRLVGACAARAGRRLLRHRHMGLGLRGAGAELALAAASSWHCLGLGAGALCVATAGRYSR